jgi:hypothetical protein
VIGAIVELLARHGFQPETYDEASFDEKLEGFIFDSFENDHIERILELNRMMNLTSQDIFDSVSEDSGPYCSILRTSLESRCRCETCPMWDKTFSFSCARYGDDPSITDEGLPQLLSEVAFQASNKVLEEALPPKFDYFYKKGCTVCGATQVSNRVTHMHNACDACVDKTLGGLPALHLEVGYGRPAREVLEFVIRRWHTPQDQARMLGMTTEDLHSLFKVFSLNATKYRVKGERRFTNPFVSRKKIRVVVDGFLQRLWFRYVGYRRIYTVSPAVEHLSQHLMLQANAFLMARGLPEFVQHPI